MTIGEAEIAVGSAKADVCGALRPYRLKARWSIRWGRRDLKLKNSDTTRLSRLAKVGPIEHLGT